VVGKPMSSRTSADVERVHFSVPLLHALHSPLQRPLIRLRSIRPMPSLWRHDAPHCSLGATSLACAAQRLMGRHVAVFSRLSCSEVCNVPVTTVMYIMSEANNSVSRTLLLLEATGSRYRLRPQARAA